MRKKTNSGQALLIILLIMAVALTIGLSVVSRSVTEIRLSQEQEESARAFSAAEAGLEHYLATGTAPSEDLIEGFTITTDISNLGDSAVFVFPNKIRADNTQTVWLVGHDNGDLGPSVKFTGGEIRVFWGNEETPYNDPKTPALEAILYYEEGGEFKTKRHTGDPNPGRRSDNNFQAAGHDGYSPNDETFQFFMRVQNLPAGAVYYALRLKLIYNDTAHLLGVKGIGDSIPLQGKCYQSTAQSAESGIASKVEQCQLYSSLPTAFDYVLFSSGSLTK